MAVRLPAELRSFDTVEIAGRAGLCVVDDSEPGYTRRRWGRGFRYLDDGGSAVDDDTKARLVAMAVPPAWEQVWFARPLDAHLLATGRDDLQRKQYRYHDAFRRLADELKFDRLAYFGRAVADLRKAVADDLEAGRPGERRLAVAAAVGLIDQGALRVGNRRSERMGHYGATTLVPDHLEGDGRKRLRLAFVGKGGAERSVEVDDPSLVAVLRELADLDDARLFAYEGSDGSTCSIGASDVNDYLATHAGRGFSAKDLRTWAGTVTAVEAVAGGASEIEAVDAAAAALGNTRATARGSYVHPRATADPDAVRAAWRASRSGAWLDRAESATAKLLAP